MVSLDTGNDARKNLALNHSAHATRISGKKGAEFVALVFSEPDVQRHDTSTISYLETHHGLLVYALALFVAVQ